MDERRTNKRVLIPVMHPIGGIRTYLIYNLKHIHASGSRFTFFGCTGEGFRKFKEDVQTWEGTEFAEVPESNRLTMFLALFRLIKSRRFSLIHSQGLQIGTLVAAANWFARIPHLITLHDVIIPKQNDFGRFAWFKQKIAGTLTRRAACIIPVSHDCEENHYEYFPVWKRGPVQVQPILNGIDVERMNRSKTAFEQERQPDLRKQFGIGSETILGGFFGRFMPQKGFDIVLKALKILAERGYGDRFHILATADHSGYRSETFAAAAENPDVAAMVHFIEAVPDITPLLAQTDVVIMPSRWEACGLVAMEAMVAGTPVIGSDALGLREVLHGTPSMMVPKDSPEKLAEAVTAFIDNAAAVKQKAAAFAEEACRRFDVRLAAEQLAAIYRNIFG